MCRSLCSIVLLPTLVFAQSKETMDSHPSQAERSPQRPCLFQYTYHSQVRRGTSEKVAIEVVFVGPPSENFPAVLPLSLELEGKDGLTVTNIEYPKTYGHAIEVVGEEYKATNGGVIKFRIRTNKDTRLGTHLLKGKLTFKVVTAEAVSTPEKIDIQMPLTLVASNAKVTRTWPYHHEPSKGELILLSPLLVPYAVVAGIGCTVGLVGDCPL